MESFSLQNLLPYVLIGVGLCLLLYALLKTTNSEHLKEKGEKAEGIIFDTDSELRGGISFVDSDNSTGNVKDKITVRFVTNKQEWITGDITQAFAIFHTWQYKPGDKVIVYYNPLKPSDFYVETGQSELLGRVMAGLLSLACIGVGFFLLFSS